MTAKAKKDAPEVQNSRYKGATPGIGDLCRP